MKTGTIKSILVALFSAGWLVPVWLGVATYLSFWQVEGWPLLLGKQTRLSSFPYISFSLDCFSVGFAWLGAVILFWAYVGYVSFRSRHEA